MIEQLNKIKFNNPPRQLTILLSTLEVINTAFNINKNLPYEGIYQFILPLFVILYTGPLCGNFITNFFKPTQDLLIAYFVGATIFIAIKKHRNFQKITNVAHMYNKINMILTMRNSDQPTFLYVFWILICSFTGSITFKFVVRNEHPLCLTESEFRDIFGTVFCLLVSKFFRINDFFLAILVSIVYASAAMEVKHCCLFDRTNEQENTCDAHGDENDSKISSSETSADSTIEETEVEESEKVQTSVRKRGRPRKIKEEDSTNETTKKKSNGRKKK